MKIHRARLCRACGQLYIVGAAHRHDPAERQAKAAA